MKQKTKKRKIVRIYAKEMFKFKEFIKYLFMLILTTIMVIGLLMLDELPPFESWLVLLFYTISLFWMGREIIFRQRALFMFPSLLLLVAFIVPSDVGNLIEASMKVLLVVMIIYILDFLGVLYSVAKFIVDTNK